MPSGDVSRCLASGSCVCMARSADAEIARGCPDIVLREQALSLLLGAYSFALCKSCCTRSRWRSFVLGADIASGIEVPLRLNCCGEQDAFCRDL